MQIQHLLHCNAEVAEKSLHCNTEESRRYKLMQKQQALNCNEELAGATI
jgi:hypothetical protein